MSSPLIVGLGEVLWDVFADGPRFGGAPANFACSAAELAGRSAHVCIVSAVGDDELGRQAVLSLREHAVDTAHLQTAPRPTGRVMVQLDDQGRASYVFDSDTAWDNLQWSPVLESLAKRTTAVCFGTLGQRSALSRETIRQFVRATPPECLRVLDINLRPPYWTTDIVLESLPLANVLKLNDGELLVLGKRLGLSGSHRIQLQQLMKQFSMKLVALTRGSLGSLLLRAEGGSSDHSGHPTGIADTVGAGDAFTAALVLGLLQGQPLGEINARANRVAAWVCSQPGATPRFPEELKQAGGTT